MKRMLPLAPLLFIVLSTVFGCASMFQSGFKGLPPTAEAYRKKALDHERKGELLEARMAWHVVARLDPQNSSTDDIIQALNRGIARAAQKQYREGVENYNKGDYAAAQRNFLIVLRFAPTHRSARGYLGRCLYRNDPARYKVQKGDSFFKIATETYNDPTKANIVAYYNGLDPDKPLMVGKVLLLPALDPQFMVPRADIKAMVSRARKAMGQKAYDIAISITTRILEEVPGHQEARRLMDQAHFAKANSMIERKEYLAALGELKKISPRHEGREAAISSARKHIQQEAMAEKVSMAKSLMEQKSYADAINVIEEILAQNPNYGPARFLLNAANYAAARDLIENEKDEMAIRHLRAIQQPYEDTDQLIAQARARLYARAESFYRKGVKHFLNEDLELAIRAWQQALSLNPNHPKAGQDIVNATELLDKWRGLENEQ